MMTLLTVLLVISCLMIVGAVLLQPSKEGGSSPFGGSSQSLFGSTGATTFLFRLTMWLGAFVLAICLIIARLRITEGKSSVLDRLPVAGSMSPKAPIPGASPTHPDAAPTTTVPAAPIGTPNPAHK